MLLVRCHVSGVTCHVSHVRCHLKKKNYNMVELVGGGSGINGAYPVYFLEKQTHADLRLIVGRLNGGNDWIDYS